MPYSPRCYVGYLTCPFCSDFVSVRSPERTRCYKIQCRRAHDRKRQAEFVRKARQERGAAWAKLAARKRAANRADGFTESKAAAYQRRRARKAGAEAERFRNSEIFERDGWLCGICETEVDSSLAYPDPMSASLDHIVPLSKGGGHTRANTQCSHLVCNVRKGARLTA